MLVLRTKIYDNEADTRYSNTASGDTCIQFYLPKCINKKDTTILEKSILIVDLSST